MGLVGSLVTCKKAGFMEGVVRKIQFKPQIGTVALLKLMVTFIFFAYRRPLFRAGPQFRVSFFHPRAMDIPPDQ